MTVRCPRCGTTYRAPAGAARASEAGFRCARCKHVFGRTEPEPEEPDEDEPAAVDEEDDRFVLGDEDDDEPEIRPERRMDTEKKRERAPARDETPRAASTPLFALRALLLVTLGYTILSIYLYTHPAAMREWLAAVPIIGSDLTESRLAPSAIQLTNVQGDYRRVQGDQLVFVVSGVAINNSPVAVRGIQIEGRAIGDQEQRQVVFCGAAPRSVEDLSVREIALLQTLEPPKEWALAPGEQASFAVVFGQPPVRLKEFTAEVVAVQGRTPATHTEVTARNR
jgi:predicted Zn finger-like uncharacterized protein